MLSDTGGSKCPESARGDAREFCGEGSVIAVTITHGDLQHLVRRVLGSLLTQPGIERVVLVTNGVRWDVRSFVEELDPSRIEPVVLDTNRGSAVAYAAGIRRACDLGAEWIWLLDGDNEPEERALAELLMAYKRLSQRFCKDNLAVAAYRPLYQCDLVAGITPKHLRWRPSCFWGFHVFDLPYRLWRRTPWGRARLRGPLPYEVELDVAMFGGLLFHRAVVERHGLPREDFILYADDSEFTRRITQSGGAVRLITSAVVNDLDDTWETRQGNRFPRWLIGGSPIRVFYSARNHAYLSKYCFKRSSVMFWVNRVSFCTIVRILAMLYGRTDRYRIFKKAVREGLEGRLGVHPEYPISEPQPLDRESRTS